MAVGEGIYCTLVLNDGYLPGAAVLAHSLRDAGTTKKLACLIVPENLRRHTIEELQSLFNYVIPVEQIGTPNPANLYLMNRPDLLYAFTKINLWALTQFRKIVYVDADIVALRAPEELFDIEESFAAAPDVGWPDAFNTGVMVISPSQGDLSALRTLASAGDSFDGADQGLLNQYYEFKPWKRISFTYNATPSANYQYEPAYRYYKRDISMVHFIGSEKPWQRGRRAKGMSSSYQELLSRWWAVWDRHYEKSTTEYIDGLRHPLISQDQRSFGQSQNQQVASHLAPSTHAAFMTEPGEATENVSQGVNKSTSTVEQSRFSAPHMEWDATRDAPPIESRPEAGNFPTQVYEFNTNAEPFRPPAYYPEPPKNMWYEVPDEKPRLEDRPKAIFPWEERQMAKPTRRFVEDENLYEADKAAKADMYADELEVLPEPVTPTLRVSDEGTPGTGLVAAHQAFTSSRNAWDDVGGIDDYVRSLTAFQRNRGKVQVVSGQRKPSTGFPSRVNAAEPGTDDPVARIDQRRESLILTDFPSAIERPSLPVTPAPRRRNMFWGSEEGTSAKREDEALPEAEGVPTQSEWDPTSQLEQLRRNSLLSAGALNLHLPMSMKKDIPRRDMPASAVAMTERTPSKSEFPSPELVGGAGTKTLSMSGGSSPHGLATEMNTAMNAATTEAETVGGKLFRDPGFGNGVDELERKEIETVLSPTS